MRDLVVVVALDEGGLPRAVDTVAADTFVDLTDIGDGTAVIRSLAVEPVTLVPYVRVTTFPIAENAHVCDKARQWKSLSERLN
ncbi:hypothetical protein ASC78_26295 [Variovorax sp. Root318D1]|nr:hypothetical protein ASC78_26295 [Variovorax sp. Root318D1]